MNAADDSGDYLAVRVEVTRMRWTGDGPGRPVPGTRRVVVELHPRVRGTAAMKGPLAFVLREASDEVMRLAFGREVGEPVDPFWLDDGRAARAT